MGRNGGAADDVPPVTQATSRALPPGSGPSRLGDALRLPTGDEWAEVAGGPAAAREPVSPPSSEEPSSFLTAPPPGEPSSFLTGHPPGESDADEDRSRGLPGQSPAPRGLGPGAASGLPPPSSPRLAAGSGSGGQGRPIATSAARIHRSRSCFAPATSPSQPRTPASAPPAAASAGPGPTSGLQAPSQSRATA